MARVILETLRSIPVPDVHHDLRRVLAIISRLGEDSGMTGTYCVDENNHHYHNNNARSHAPIGSGRRQERRPLMDGFQSVVSISLPSFQERARTRFVSNLCKLFRNTRPSDFGGG